MTETDLIIENPTKDIKLYSSQAIRLATFLGGPLAAGYLIGENYKALDREKDGRNSLMIGIISTIILLGAFFILPETTIVKIPRHIIPLIYTGIVWGIVEWKQGDILTNHKESENTFFSGWRAAGIGLVSMIILIIGLFGYVFFGMNNEAYDQYDTQIAEFTKNETETLVFYDHLNTKTRSSLIQELENTTIPKWKENIEIINKTNEIENLPSELLDQNKLLLKYSELRLEAFELFKKDITEDTDNYFTQLDEIHQEIDKLIERLDQNASLF